MKKNATTRIDFNMIDKYNEYSIKSISMQQRKCRFADEVNDIKLHYIYSDDICVLEVQISEIFFRKIFVTKSRIHEREREREREKYY